MSDTRQRFLRAIAERVPPERIVDVYLFPPLRQGGVEGGVAIVAAMVDGALPPGDVAHADDVSTTVGSHEDDMAARTRARVESRHTVFTAQYRLTLKGPDRGKWELDMVAQAEAPLATLGAVVRGVQDRAGDLAAPERLSGEELRLASVDRFAPTRQSAETPLVKSRI